MAQKLLDDKEKEIQTLKKKLKIPSTELSQEEELVEFEREKETLNAELTNCKAKLLKLEEKERQWEAYIQLLKKSDAELKTRLAMREKELQGRSAESTIQSTSVAGEIDTGSLSREMSQIGLKDIELIKLKQQIEELEKERVKEKQGREKTEEKCQAKPIGGR